MTDREVVKPEESGSSKSGASGEWEKQRPTVSEEIGTFRAMAPDYTRIGTRDDGRRHVTTVVAITGPRRHLNPHNLQYFQHIKPVARALLSRGPSLLE